MQIVKFATVLVTAEYSVAEAATPKAREIALARLEGLAAGYAALVGGVTPFSVRMVSLDAIRSLGPRPVASAGNEARKEHAATMVAAVYAALVDL